MTQPTRFAVLAAAVVCISGCSSGDATPTATDTGSVRTVANCETNIAADVPAFFKDYFGCVDITVSGTNIIIKTKDLPPHKSYYYGEGHSNYEAFDYSRGSQYKPNPNKIADQSLTMTIPITPKPRGITIDKAKVDGVVGTSNQEFKMGPAGVALDSVALFNPLAAPGDDIENEKYTFDSYDARPAGPTYHYHTSSPGPLEVLKNKGLTISTTPGSATVEIFGVMCDGTVVMGCTEADGSAPDASGFDAQNGHSHDIKNKAGAVLLAGRYHTHVCPTKFTSYKYTPEIQFYDTCSI